MINNNFVIKHAGKTIRRHNSINNVFDFYKTFRKMCSYIYVKYGDTDYLFKTPVLLSQNFDPDKGRLYVSYEASLNAAEIGGKTIESVGFAASQSPDLIVNTCNVMTKKQEGEPMIISGTLYLSACAGSGLNAALVKGDNRLVRMLLGAEAFDTSLFRMTYGIENTPMAAYVYQGKYPSVSSPPVMDSQQMAFSAGFAGKVTDTVLLCDGQAVLRAMPKLAETTASKAYSATENDSLTFPADDMVTKIDNVVIGYSVVSAYTLTRVPSSLAYVRTEKFVLPAGANIKSDASGRYFAYVCDGRAALFRLQDARMSITKWFAARDVLLCENGAAFIISDDGSVTLYDGDNETPVSIKAGAKSAAAFLAGRYAFATWREGKIWVYYMIYGDEITAVSFDSAENADDVRVFSMPESVCAVASGHQSIVYTPVSANTQKKNWLDSICNSTWFLWETTPIYDNGRLLLYDAYFDRTSYYADMSTKQITLAPYGRLYAEFNIRGNGLRTDISLADDIVQKFLTVDGEVRFAVCCDRFLYLFMSDGSVGAYYIGSQALRLRSSKITTGFSVSFRMYTAQAASGPFTIKIKRN